MLVFVNVSSQFNKNPRFFRNVDFDSILLTDIQNINGFSRNTIRCLCIALAMGAGATMVVAWNVWSFQVKKKFMFNTLVFNFLTLVRKVNHQETIYPQTVGHLVLTLLVMKHLKKRMPKEVHVHFIYRFEFTEQSVLCLLIWKERLSFKLSSADAI